MAKKKRGRAKVGRGAAKPAGRGTRRRGGKLAPVPAPHPLGWRGAGAAREPGVPGPPARDPAQDEEYERSGDR